MHTIEFSSQGTRTILAMLFIVLVAVITIAAGASPTAFVASGAAISTFGVSHHPASPSTLQEMTIKAEIKDQLSVPPSINIFVDNNKVKTCATFVCKYTTASSKPGVHTYYARAFDNKGNSVRDPPFGTKIFRVADLTKPKVSISHSPEKPIFGAKVTYAATASDNAGLRELQLYVDNLNVKTCKSSPCTYSATYNVPGGHTYYAVAIDTSGNSARDYTGEKKFFIIGDNTPPSINVRAYKLFTSYREGRFVTGILLEATASDNFGLGNITLFLVNRKNDNVVGVNVCSITKRTSSTCSLFFENPSIATYGYGADVYDTSGNYARDPYGDFYVVKWS